MKRYAISRLQEWKEDPNRLPMIIRGARQVGKTWLMQEFGRTAFERCAYINFDRNERMHNLFSGDFDVDRILRGLAIESGVEIDPENTLIILDEIQEVPAALQSLKYFCEDNRHSYYILAAESLLGIAMHEGTSFPVGKVDTWICTRFPLPNSCPLQAMTNCSNSWSRGTSEWSPRSGTNTLTCSERTTLWAGCQRL